MKNRLKTALRAAGALFSLSAAAVQSPLPSASWVPAQTRSLTESAEYLIALPTARTFLDSLKAEDCWNWRKRLEAELSAAPSNPEQAAMALKSSLVRLGFEPENIVSTDNFRKSDPVLRSTVCVRHGFTSAQQPPLLVFSSLGAKEAANTAAAFALARNLQRFRLDPVRSVWFCAGTPGLGLSELIARSGHVQAKGQKFFSLLRIEGNSPQVFGNFMGEKSLEIRISSQELSWGKTDSQENAKSTLDAIAQALRALSETAPRARRTPYAQTSISEVSCQRTLLSSVKPSCSLSVHMRSRDMQTMQNMASQFEAIAGNVLADRNKSTDARFRIRVTSTAHRNPTASPRELGTVLAAWRGALGASQPRDAFLSTAFVVSDARFASEHGLPSLAMSAIEPYPREKGRSQTLFETLAKTILILCGAKIDSTTVPALAPQTLDFTTGGEALQAEPTDVKSEVPIAPRQPEGQLE